MATKKWVYRFSAEQTEGNRNMKDLLGGKGANLSEMASLGLRVPPGFTISTEACIDYQNNKKVINDDVRGQVLDSLSFIEKITQKKFGDPASPLLFSVRSGARASMPGMMDTVLNLGLNEKTVEGLARETNNPRFAWDSYRRFIQMYANVVIGLNISLLEACMEDMKEARGYHLDTDLQASDLKELVGHYRRIILEETGKAFPTDPAEQLWMAVGAVFGSWNNTRAIKYRNLHNIPHNWGTAVNIQSMVFGNLGEDSATGVCFTRDPGTGQRRFFGEYLLNAQGEDVVAGIRTPGPINNFSKNDGNRSLKTLEEVMPVVYGELCDVYQKLEHHYRDMQDIEFTVEKQKLYILQTRNGKRTANAGIQIAVDLVREKILTEKEALMRVNPEDLNQLLHPRLDPNAKKEVLAQGLPASPGAASGEIVFTADQAVKLHEAGKKVMLVRQETSPEDIAGMVAAEGIVTARGGMTSHAAVVARGMGKPCVAGCSALKVDHENRILTIKDREYKEGDFLTIDGATGEVMEGIVPTLEAKVSDSFGEFMKWADAVRRLKVRANADNPQDAFIARKFGAQGIGLCRTEHMFFDPERILAVREMIFAKNKTERERALAKLLPFQRDDFFGIFKAMDGLPSNIRLLDPPLHEFLPHELHEKEELARALHVSLLEVDERAKQLHEFNPMLGHRGCRLGITFPEIYKVQVRAILEAGIMAQTQGIKVYPEIMIPLVATLKELTILKQDLEEVAKQVFAEKKQTIEYKVGTMIELPRAAIMAGELAQVAEFFSYGTNDLTQTTFGLSRDDAGKFLGEYVAKGILDADPFITLDQSGVGFLIEYSNKIGKEKNPKLHTGICGEHGGESRSIQFCHRAGLDYVSCSPFRVPIARLAAAQAAIEHGK
ncbi:MAG: pyruvate, phosphate dikinase [Bdellovibrionales bacterium GWA2_49_15]|nr:MAG: pyruvate, phosphate dikinase [Bdellovibrionales bacterium GWA2_49_15]HAZ11904.1 pyruvate, phosphate dikinase [Bdellovibrionales bacterium]